MRAARGETSDIGLVCHSLPTHVLLRPNRVRLVACSSPVRSAIPLPDAPNSVKSSIASAVITASVGKPRASRIAAAKLASGMDPTSTCAVAVVVSSMAVKSSIKTAMSIFFICIDFLVSFRGNASVSTRASGVRIKFLRE